MISQALAKLYFRHFQIVPKNFIVYRDGGSDGSFESIRKEEASAVRNTILELNKVVGQDIDPKITFIVAQKDHNIRIVEESKSSRSGNVPSGTLVDSCITSHESDGSFDFLLTPQGGLKGTSKPMLYRVILNENVAGRERLTRDDIYNMTYRMAFQCKLRTPFLFTGKASFNSHLCQSCNSIDGTATKAPRKVPVLLNSERLANRVIKYGGCKYTASNCLDSVLKSHLSRCYFSLSTILFRFGLHPVDSRRIWLDDLWGPGIKFSERL